MNAPQFLAKEYLYTSEVLVSTDEDDFYVEIYPYTPILKSDGIPVTVIHNFDELIEFFEEEQIN